MITELRGDIFSSRADAIVHATNSQGKIGSGFSKLIAARYPLAHGAYLEGIQSGTLKAGSTQLNLTQPHRIINMVVQTSIGEPPWNKGRTHAHPHLIERGLDAILGYYDEGLIASVAIPRIGCNRGGLYWNEEDYAGRCAQTRRKLDRPRRQFVQDLIYSKLEKTSLPVELWTYDKSTAS